MRTHEKETLNFLTSRCRIELQVAAQALEFLACDVG
jgi:hypothetical protein